MITTFRRNALLSVLLLAFLFMSGLVVQQSRTIASQRTLIKQLFQDSLELSALKIERAHARR